MRQGISLVCTGTRKDMFGDSCVGGDFSRFTYWYLSSMMSLRSVIPIQTIMLFKYIF